MTKKYRPLFILRLFFWVIPLLSAGMALSFVVLLDWLFSRLPLLAIPVLVYVILALYSLFISLRIRLEISDKGISFYNATYIISTTWDNIERISKRVAGNNNFPVEGLVLRRPSAIKPSIISSIFLSSELGYYEVDYSRSIPLQGMWAWNWRKSELAEDLRHYLPHLF